MRVKASPGFRWFYLALSFAAMLFAGILYAWSILKAPFQEAFAWTDTALALNYTVTICCFCLGGMLAGQMLRRLSPRLVVLLGAVLTALGFFLVSRLQGQIAMLYLAYGVLCGFGIGFAYNALVTVSSAWFPDKRGFCSGVMMMGFGLSTLVLGNAAAALMERYGWPFAYVCLSVGTGAVLLLAGLFSRMPRPEELPAELGQKKTAAWREAFPPQECTTGEMLCRSSFYRYYIFNVCLCAVGGTVISIARDLPLHLGAPEQLAVTLAGALSVCNGVSRVCIGLVCDRLGRRPSMLLAGGLAVATALALLAAEYFSSVAACAAGICLAGLSYGCAPTLGAVFVTNFYGRRAFASNFGIANTTLLPSAFMPALVVSLASGRGDYLVSLAVLLAAGMVSLLFAASLKRP